jgi:hypothetical protein
MAYDEVEHLLKTWATDKANKLINDEIERYMVDHMKRENELLRKERAFEDGKRTIYRRIKELKQRTERALEINAQLTKRIDQYRNDANAANRHANEYEQKAAKYDTIKAALA